MKAWLYILLVFDVFHDGLFRYHSCTPYIIRARPQCGQTAPQPIMALSKHMGRIPLHLVDYQLRGDGRGVPNTIECDMMKVCSSPFPTDSILQPNSKSCWQGPLVPCGSSTTGFWSTGTRHTREGRKAGTTTTAMPS